MSNTSSETSQSSAGAPASAEPPRSTFFCELPDQIGTGFLSTRGAVVIDGDASYSFAMRVPNELFYQPFAYDDAPGDEPFVREVIVTRDQSLERQSDMRVFTRDFNEDSYLGSLTVEFFNVGQGLQQPVRMQAFIRAEYEYQDNTFNISRSFHENNISETITGDDRRSCKEVFRCGSSYGNAGCPALSVCVDSYCVAERR